MRFSVALSLVASLAAGGVCAAKPKATFDDNREAILAGDRYKAGGYYFGVGRGVARSARSVSDSFAKEKAVQDAKADLVGRKAVEGVAWPRELGNHAVAVLARLAYRHVPVRATVSDVEVVLVEKTGADTYTAVVAAAEESLKGVPCASLGDMRQVLLSPHRLKANFKKHPKESYEFYLTQKSLPDELAETDFSDWDDAQLDLFCGIPHLDGNDKAAGERAEADTPDARQQKDGNVASEDGGFIGRINETLEF